MKIYSGKAKWAGKCTECGDDIKGGQEIFVIDEGTFLIAKLRTICAKCKEERYPNVKVKSMWKRLIGIR